MWIRGAEAEIAEAFKGGLRIRAAALPPLTALNWDEKQCDIVTVTSTSPAIAGLMRTGKRGAPAAFGAV